MSAVIGLDHGSRRIGIAVGDTGTRMAFARPAIRTASQRAAAQAVIALAQAERAERVVVGLPLSMNGSEGRQAAAARRFGDLLHAAGLDVAYVDERLTSWEASERLPAAGDRRKARLSGVLDSAAATLILQQYLDALGDPSASQETE